MDMRTKARKALSGHTEIKRNRFEDLKIGTCITSAWFCFGAQIYLTLAPWSMETKTVLGAAIGMAGISFVAEKFKGAQFWKSPNHKYISEKPSASTLANAHDIALKLGMKDTPPVRLTPLLKRGGAASTRGGIFLLKELFNQLTPNERKFVIGHELAHDRFNDLATSDMLTVPVNTSPVLWPGVAVGVYSMAGGINLGFSGILALGVGAAAATILKDTVQSLSNKASRIAEYRADRVCVQATGDPISAISTHAKVSTFEFVAHSTSHPTRNERILRIAADFSKANPERAITIETYGTMAGSQLSATSSPMLLVNAEKYDGNHYVVSWMDFSVFHP